MNNAGVVNILYCSKLDLYSHPITVESEASAWNPQLAIASSVGGGGLIRSNPVMCLGTHPGSYNPSGKKKKKKHPSKPGMLEKSSGLAKLQSWKKTVQKPQKASKQIRGKSRNIHP